MIKLIFIFVAVFTIFGMSSGYGQENIEKAAAETISENSLRGHIRFLSHDLLEGRGVNTHGIKIAQEYLAAQMAVSGIDPGGPDGTYFQAVPLKTLTVSPLSTCRFSGGGKRLNLKYGEDFIILSGGLRDTVQIQGEIVFAGYGIKADEYNWDDYKNTDVSGKIVVVFMGEPSNNDSTFFKGTEVTGYSQPKYKSTLAEQKGALGIIYIHTPLHYGYSWDLIKRFVSRPRIRLDYSDPENRHIGFQYMINENAAEKLFSTGSIPFLKIGEMSESRDFKPVYSGISINTNYSRRTNRFRDRNVIGIIPGSKREEYIIYTAHMDHMGIMRPVNGDSIYNGAVDNAAGCASILEIGRAFAGLQVKPDRSIIILSVTAEESGLLGSEYYAKNPVYPLEKTLAVLNLDGSLPMPEMKNFLFLGDDRSTIGELAREVAADNGISVTPDPMPEEGFYLRSDHYSLAKAGVPGGSIDVGTEFAGKEKGWGIKYIEDWLQTTYHKPNDEYSEDWEMGAVVQVARIGFQMGYRLTKAKKWPEWYEGQPFKKIRDKQLKK